MKNKKGFTLIEIVATLGLISIILIIAIPVISNIRKSIMVRELESKKEAIVSAAEVYAQNNQSLFPKEGGIIQIPVRTLVYYGYINEDSTDCDDAIGCVMNPVNNTSMNNEIISIKKIKSVTQATFGEVNEHVITFHANGATSVGGSSNFISIGCDTFTNSTCTIRVPSIERDEFTKVGFGESANSTTANYLVGQDILFNDNISNNGIKENYYAITSKGVIVTFNASTNGGTLTTGVGTLDKNCTIQNQQNTCSIGTSDPGVNDRAGYIRKAGWYNNSSGGNVVATRSFSSNQTLYAQWDACQKGYYALAGATSCTACSVGAYSASIGSSSCAVCGAGKTTSGTGTQASSSCTDCSNKAHVATWETPTWSPNSVTNLCKIKTCESGYKISNNTCVSDYTFAFNYTGNFRVNNETTVRTGDYSFTTSNWKVYLITSGTFTPKIATTVDIFAVGGGGSGSSGKVYGGGGGGAGGYTNTVTNKSLTVNSGYSVTIGTGGSAVTGLAVAGNSGNTTSFGSLCSASGGSGGGAAPTWRVGGAGGTGGSGGGGGRYGSSEYSTNIYSAGDGGSNGSAGGRSTTEGDYNAAGGTGCSTNNGCKKNGSVCNNTREFCESSGTIYAGGGGGGAALTDTNGRYNGGSLIDPFRFNGGDPGSGGGGAGAFIVSYHISGNEYEDITNCTGSGCAQAKSGTPNTGGGGGGAGSLRYSNRVSTSGAGGSGVVVIRNKR